MASAVLDSSAILAFAKAEPGGEAVLRHVGTGAISAVNVQEVAKALLARGFDMESVRLVFARLRLEIHDHDLEAALAAAALVPATARFGSGLGDRSCMALGIALGVPVLTADREWVEVEVDGLRVEPIR